MTTKNKEVKGTKSKEEIVASLRQADVQARQERLNKKFDIALSEEQFSIRLINKCNPQTLEVAPGIQLVDLKYAENKA